MGKENGGSAFPSANEVKLGGCATTGHPGMTLLDYFAAQFIAGRASIPGYVDPQIDADLAYSVARAMLAAREVSE